MPTPRETATLFMQHVAKTPDGHWEWTGPYTFGNPARAGRFTGGNYSNAVARVAGWELRHGKPAEGYVQATCDHPQCVNPDHLEDGPRPVSHKVGPQTQALQDIAERLQRLEWTVDAIARAVGISFLGDDESSRTPL